jgi:hypothetical protein
MPLRNEQRFIRRARGRDEIFAGSHAPHAGEAGGYITLVGGQRSALAGVNIQ